MTMKILCVASAMVSTVALVSATEQGAGGAQSTAPAATAQTSRPSADEQITVTGCIQREEDYRRATSSGRGGAANTGIGLGNEFVLTNASMSNAAPGSTATSGGGAPTATGTAGTAARGTAYELSGANEGKASAFVGKRVEITGKLKPAETGAAGATGGPTANAPLSQDLKLRELDVTSIRESAGSCTAP